MSYMIMNKSLISVKDYDPNCFEFFVINGLYSGIAIDGYWSVDRTDYHYLTQIEKIVSIEKLISEDQFFELTGKTIDEYFKGQLDVETRQGRQLISFYNDIKGKLE